MTANHDDIKLLKKISTHTSNPNENIFKDNKIKGKTLSPLKVPNKNISLKPLNFNPSSFVSYKYPPKTLMLMNRKKINLNDNFGNSKNISFLNNIDKDKDKREYIYCINTKKIKLKSLNKNRSCSQIFPKSDNIFFPSGQTSQDIINYNMLNTHNTILNNYHKNPTNFKIINFVKTNSFNPNNDSITMNKNISLNRSSYNISCHASKNEIINNNQKFDCLNPILNIDIKNNINYPNISSVLKEENTNTKCNTKKNKKKIKIDYELDMFDKKFAHNLKFFSNKLFEEDKNKRKKTISPKKRNNNENTKNFLESRNNSNINYQVIDFKGKARLIATNLTNKNRKPTFMLKHKKSEDFRHIMKYPFDSPIEGKKEKMNHIEQNNLAKKIQQLIINPNTSKVRNNQILLSNKVNNNDKNMSYKEIREISKKGFEKMEADKFRRFNLLVENTNKEVIQLEKRLDELLEVNKKIFLDAKEE